MQAMRFMAWGMMGKWTCQWSAVKLGEVKAQLIHNMNHVRVITNTLYIRKYIIYVHMAGFLNAGKGKKRREWTLGQRSAYISSYTMYVFWYDGF